MGAPMVCISSSGCGLWCLAEGRGALADGPFVTRMVCGFECICLPETLAEASPMWYVPGSFGESTKVYVVVPDEDIFPFVIWTDVALDTDGPASMVKLLSDGGVKPVALLEGRMNLRWKYSPCGMDEGASTLMTCARDGVVNRAMRSSVVSVLNFMSCNFMQICCGSSPVLCF